LTSETARLGINSTTVDTCDLPATAAAMTDRTRLVVVETITNPLLRVSDIGALAEICQPHKARLLVDNSFASPIVCRPKELGADLVMESLTKIINGHSDTVLGLLCGSEAAWGRVPKVLSRWGLASSPMDCWLSLRGLATLALRARQASENALAAARFLAGQKQVERVYYPGLESHPDHALARRQFDGQFFGSIVSFTLTGGRAAAEQFIAAGQIPFCPSLGEVSTTLSHPQSTSHRGLSETDRQELGITGGTIRLSLGIESTARISEQLSESL
jgi:cystathionine beta-lyase/cystathionine gamma-synthase